MDKVEEYHVVDKIKDVFDGDSNNSDNSEW